MEIQKVEKFFENHIKQWLLILATIIIMLVIFLALIILSPIYIYRFLVSKLKFIGPNLGNIVTTGGSFLVHDDIYSKPKSTILVQNVIKGDFPDIDFLRKFLAEKVTNLREENGEFKYEELRQYPYKWMGFFFWKWEDDFHISEHLNDYYSQDTNQSSKCSQGQLREIESSLIQQPFEKKRSPWEIIVIRNVESKNGEPQTVAYFRIHHSIADGFSILKTIFTALVDNGTNPMDDFLNRQNAVKNNCDGHSINFCKNVLTAPYQFYQYIKYMWESIDKNEWIRPKDEDKEKRKLLISFSDKILLNDLKHIAKHHKVCLTAVIYSGFAAAMNKAMKKKSGKVPKFIHLSATLPMPGHPNKLSNHFAYICLQLPVGNFSPVERLNELQNNILKLKDSTLPAISFLTIPILGGLFPFMTKFCVSQPWNTTISSSFPGPKKSIYLFGREVEHCYFLTGSFPNNLAVNYHTITYCDGFRFTITSNNSILQNESEVEEMVKDVQEEFRILRNGCGI